MLDLLDALNSPPETMERLTERLAESFRFKIGFFRIGLKYSTALCISFIIILPVFVVCEEEHDSFFFDPSPVDQDVVEGREVRLRCDVSSRKMISFYWTLNGKQIQNSARRFQEDSDLRILRSDRVLDAGSFRCVATNISTGMALRSTEAKLNITWIVEQIEVQSKSSREGGGGGGEAVAVEGSEISLKCQVDGNPEPVVEWFRNKIKLFPGDRIRLLKNRLKLVSVASSDNGVYSCRARNAAGSVDSFSNFLLNIPGPDALRLNSETFTSRLIVKRGAKAQLHCDFSNAISTEWHFSEIRITNISGSKKYAVMKNGTLVINDVQETDAGTYRCIGSNGKTEKQTFAAELLLAYLDELTVDSFEPKPFSSPTVVPINSKFEILCRLPDGLPQPTIRWFGPGLELSSELNKSSYYSIGDANRKRMSSSDDGLLSISNAQETDSGNYSCVVQNLAGVTSKSVWIVVSVPPVLLRQPMSSRVTEDDSASFECRVTGTPFPATKISWTFDGETIELSNHRFEVDVVSGSLRLSRVSLTDEGNYACTVNTTGHSILTSNNAHLYVEKRLKFKPLPVNSKLELGSHSQIVCRADGRSLPKVKWFRDGSVGLPDQVDDLDGLLVFKDVRHSDAGRYTCIASNDQGHINVTITVDVIVKPKFKVRPLNTTVIEGQAAMLHCVAIGDPLPTIQWDRNNKVNSFDFQRFKVLANGSLSVSEVYMEDGGKYGCTAGNSGGFEHTEVYLHVVDSDSHQRLRFSGADGAVVADNFDMMKTIVIAVCSAVAYLAIVIGITVYCSIRLIRAKTLRKHADSANGQSDNMIESGMMANENTELVDRKSHEVFTIRKDIKVRSSSNVETLSSHFPTITSNRSHTMQKIFNKFSFPRNKLITLGLLGKGNYGDVFLAKAFGIQGNKESENLVMVKSLLSRTSVDVEECLREIHLFSCVNHEHIAHLFGICQETEPIYLVMEYCEWGDLKKFLLTTQSSSSSSSNSRIPTLTLTQKTSMCAQVSLGMEHISNIGLIHRDLAARNIVVSPTLDVKVSSLGLSRDVYANEYFLFDQNLIPLRWMSPEAILDGEYSVESDVWSFGVLIWEIFSSGELPLANRTNEQVLEGLNSKENRLPCPPGCPKDMWSLVQTCMSDRTHDRPSFSDIVMLIYDILSNGGYSS